MSLPLVALLALRSLGRHRRRTALSVLGVGIGCATALFIAALVRGGADLRVRGVAHSGLGHLTIAPAEWVTTRDDRLRLEDGPAVLALARQAPGVDVAAPRARAEALLACGLRTAGLRLLGVDPLDERRLNRLTGAVEQGRYLEPGDRGRAVIGAALAERLAVEVGDDLRVTVVAADGGMQHALARVVGLIATGSLEIDAGLCHVTLEDLADWTGRPGFGEVTLLLEDWRAGGRTVAALRAGLAENATVHGWEDLAPGIAGDARSDQAFMSLLAGVVIAVVVLGILGAQLTAMLERRREFAVLLALGMRGSQVLRLLLLEGSALAALGALAGLAIAVPLLHYTSTAGIDFSPVLGERMAMSGILFDTVVYTDRGPWLLPRALLIAWGSTLVGVLLPAWSAVRIRPATILNARGAA